jgi:hypothetical protein
MLLGQRRSTSSKLGGIPDCHQSRQNQTVQFAKPDHPVCSGFELEFLDLVHFVCEHILVISLGIDYFKHVKYERWKLQQ